MMVRVPLMTPKLNEAGGQKRVLKKTQTLRRLAPNPFVQPLQDLKIPHPQTNLSDEFSNRRSDDSGTRSHVNLVIRRKSPAFIPWR